MNPARLAVHVAYAPPGFISGDHLHRQTFVVINPFDRIFLARAFPHIGLLVLHAGKIGLVFCGPRAPSADREGEAQECGAQPIHGEMRISDSGALSLPHTSLLIREKTCWSSSRADCPRG